MPSGIVNKSEVPARAPSGGKMKPIEEVAIEEQFAYTTIGMSDSYFSSEVYSDHQVFYKSSPIGRSTLGVGPMGMLFAAKWIGVVFFSIISEPFYAGSKDHRAALSMFDSVESQRIVSNHTRSICRQWIDDPVVGAVLWLARTWQLLYIDIRPPNLRISEEGDAKRVHLVDYDHLVL